MSGNSVKLMLQEEGGRRPALCVSVDADCSICVRDLASRAIVAVRAAELSVYRHTVMSHGRTFRVLNLSR